MEDFLQAHNRRLAETLIRNLRRRHFDAYYCEGQPALLKQIKALIPEGSSVTWGGSATLRQSGITAMLNEGNYVTYDREGETTPEGRDRVYRQAFSCDFYLSSANALSEDGVVVNIDGNGNRVAALTWGPRHVILVVSLHKVAQDVDAAVKRTRSVAAPMNMARFSLEAPCKQKGVCTDCKAPDSICAYISIQRLSRPAGRTTVVLTDLPLGF